MARWRVAAAARGRWQWPADSLTRTCHPVCGPSRSYTAIGTTGRCGSTTLPKGAGKDGRRSAHRRSVSAIARPAAVSAYGYMDVYAIGSDNLLWHRQWSSNQWNGWAAADQRPSTASDHLGLGDLCPPHADDPRSVYPCRRGGGSRGTGRRGRRICRSRLQPKLDHVSCRVGQRLLHLVPYRASAAYSRAATGGAAGHDRTGKPGFVHWTPGCRVRRRDRVDHDSEQRRSRRVRLHIYDNEFPDCDAITLTDDPGARTIVQSNNGKLWKGIRAGRLLAASPPGTYFDAGVGARARAKQRVVTEAGEALGGDWSDPVMGCATYDKIVQGDCSVSFAIVTVARREPD